MKKIASFTVNHIDLLCGLYVSRRDKIGEETITTFDMRVTRPNVEPVMDTPAIHAIEHLGATFLRNHPVWADKTVYFGPMGCRTGFYIILAGSLEIAAAFISSGSSASFLRSVSSSSFSRRDGLISA